MSSAKLSHRASVSWLFLAVFLLLPLAAVAQRSGKLEFPLAPKGGTTGHATETAPETNPKPKADRAVSALTERALKSIAVITHYGRDGSTDGVGTGFVISSDGRIATSLHVIGEARPITVHLHDGKKYDVEEILAWDRRLDLAVLRINATNLPALPLGDSDALTQGTSVIALGNPQGFEHSVVRGVLSARRDVEEVEMLQLAIPVEPGNSGGPVIDLDGHVQGVVTLKSAVTANLAFAMPINSLKPLLEKPNPVPMSRWLTIGALNPREWTTVNGGRWTQRAGRIKVEGAGRGFGGRALCLSTKTPPEPPYEIAVTVKLDDEAGAAGLVFGADGTDRHYGFYPSNGQLRLTRFDGPDVFSWQVIEEVRSKAYRRGDWNTLRVRVEKDRLVCFVNDEQVAELENPRFAGTQAGVAKFRETEAEFKIFQVGRSVGPEAIPAELASSIEREITDLPARSHPRLMEVLQTNVRASRSVLLERAQRLEQQAKRLRALADAVHRKQIESDLLKLLETDQPDLAHGALLIARLDNDELDPATYLRQIEAMAAELKSRLPKDATDHDRIEALRKYLFTENGFHGSRTDFYSFSNSYLNEVMDDREGLPITLSILFLELGRRIGVEDLHLTSTPGHALVKFTPADEPMKLIDPFEGGKYLSREEANEIVEQTTGSRLRGEHLQTADARETFIRVLRNLMGLAERNGSPETGLHYLDLILALEPNAPLEHLQRGMLRLKIGDTEGAREDLSWLIEAEPRGLDLERIAELLRSL
jgi:S1-C subfamily serine protease/regulator of sirC expression with transglutaminase-like and TPR domain